MVTQNATDLTTGSVTRTVTQAAHGFSVGNILYLNSSTYALAQADTAAHAESVGIVSTVIGANTFVLTKDGYVTGLNGLTAGTVYFLDPAVAGGMTATAPTTLGQVSKPLFVADSTTSGYFINYRGEVLGGTLGDQSVQMVSTVVTAAATGSTQIPFDNTIPQNTEGDQYMSLAITPRTATSRLVIQIIGNMATAGASTNDLTMALFQDATANSLAAVGYYVATSGKIATLVLNYEMVSGTTSATTFKVRMGYSTTGTNTFNGAAGTGLYGGVYASSMIITEYL